MLGIFLGVPRVTNAGFGVYKHTQSSQCTQEKCSTEDADFFFLRGLGCLSRGLGLADIQRLEQGDWCCASYSDLIRPHLKLWFVEDRSNVAYLRASDLEYSDQIRAGSRG